MSGRRIQFNASARCLLVALVGALLLATPAPSQQGKEPQKSQDDVISLKAHLVTVDVMVKDKKGKFVTDLKAEDFTVFENGARQKVEFFDPPLLGDKTNAPPATPTPPSASGNTELLTPGGQANFITLVLDRQTTEMANLKQVRDGTLKYIREQITDADTVALFGVTNGLELIQTFTQEKAKLLAAVENAYLASASSKSLELADMAAEVSRRTDEVTAAGTVNLPQSAAATAQGAAAARAMIASRVLQQFVRLRAQLSLQQSRPILAALAAICEALRGIPGKKTLVLFSQGFITSSTLDWQVQSTIDLANQANVSIYVIDSSGLTANAPRSGGVIPATPLGNVSASVSTEDRMRTTGGENVFDQVRHEGLNREQDILYRISGDTGGQFIKGMNDIHKGLDRIDREIRARYTLAYYSTDANFDGGFRKLKLEVNRPGASVVARSGYYAVAGDEIVPLSPEEKTLLAKVSATADAKNDAALPLSLELSPFKAAAGHYLVPMSIELPPAAVKFNQKGEHRQMHLDVIGVIRNAEGKIISRLGGNFDITLSAAQYQAVVNNNIFYRQDMELAPGAYGIELVVRDRLTGKLAAKRESLTLPDAESAEFGVSGVVLSRLALPAAANTTDILREGGAQIRPSPAREFQTADNLIIFFKVYHAAKNAATGKPAARVTVRLMKDGQAIAKPLAYQLSEEQAEPVAHLTFANFIRLAGLAAGKYVASIEVTDTVAGKTVMRQEAFVITR